MRLKQPSFDSETAELFGVRKSRERLRTKNVRERQFFIPAGSGRDGEIAIEKSLQVSKGRDRLRDLARICRRTFKTSCRAQFLLLSTSAPFLIHGIMSRSFSPTCSIG